jgi:uncharacterized protein
VGDEHCFAVSGIAEEGALMITLSQSMTILRQQFPYLSATYGLRRVGIFGSTVKGTTHAASDIDLVVEFERPLGVRFMEFADYLEHVLQTPVDVLTPTGIQMIRDPRLAREIEESVVYV